MYKIRKTFIVKIYILYLLGNKERPHDNKDLYYYYYCYYYFVIVVENCNHLKMDLANG